MSHALTVDDDTFAATVLEADLPVLVEFWAQWCPPCHALAPILDQLAAQRAGQLIVAKLDVDDNDRTALAYDVRAMPTMIVFRGGEPVGRLLGARPRTRLAKELADILG